MIDQILIYYYKKFKAKLFHHLLNYDKKYKNLRMENLLNN